MTSQHKLIEAWAEDVLGGKPDILTVPFMPHASPSWRGVDADVRLAKRQDRTVIIKSWYEEAFFYLSPERSSLAAQHADEVGVAPRIHEYFHAPSALVMEYLGEGYRTAGLHDLQKSCTREAVIAAKKIFQQTSSSVSERLSVIDPFDEVLSLGQQLAHEYQQATFPSQEGIFYPQALPAWLNLVAEAKQHIEALGIDKCPCHREGEVTNVMLHDDGSAKLLDFDSAGISDCFEDIGIFLCECFELEADARQGFEQWLGYFDEGEYRRAWLYGVLDNLRWGIIASLLSKRSQRSSLEFAKYAGWRFLRAEIQLSRIDDFSALKIR